MRDDDDADDDDDGFAAFGGCVVDAELESIAFDDDDERDED